MTKKSICFEKPIFTKSINTSIGYRILRIKSVISYDFYMQNIFLLIMKSKVLIKVFDNSIINYILFSKIKITINVLLI